MFKPFRMWSPVFSEIVSKYGPSPTDPAAAAKLLYLWVVADEKPNRGCIGLHGVYGVELPYLGWLLKSGSTEPLRLLSECHPDQAGAFVSWVTRKRRIAASMLEGPERITGGGGDGRQIGVIHYRAWIDFCAHVLTAAKEAGIYRGDPNLVIYYVYSRNQGMKAATEWRNEGVFASEEQSIEAAKNVIKKSLQSLNQPSMNADQLKKCFEGAGRLPSIYSVARSTFHPLRYAQQLSIKLARSKGNRNY